MSQLPVVISTARTRPKYVFAHFMVGNTYPYTEADWTEDIKLAHANGFDGFALNVGREHWQKHRVSDCYNAASHSGLSFKLFISFDMTSIPGSSKDDIEGLADYIRPYVRHNNQFYHDGKLVISTFSGQNSFFGYGSFEDGWKHAKAQLEKITPIALIPAFFINPTRYPSLPFMDGYFNWNGSWPIHLTAASHHSQISQSKLQTDHEHLHHLGGRTFMAAASPWFFTHYGSGPGPHSWNKNWIYRGDDWLFVRRWEQLIAMRDQIDIVQVISWNDYGESHYVGPIKGAQPNSQAWVDGFPHEPWLYINSYFAEAFKNGNYPRIQLDKIILWARPHSKDALAPDTVPKPDNWQLTDDMFWIVVFASGPATLALSSPTTTPDLYEIDPGVTKVSYPIIDGGNVKASLFRHCGLVVELHAVASGFRYQNNPETYNFNVFVAMSA